MLLVIQNLDQELTQFGWMMLIAQGMSLIYLIVIILDGVLKIVVIVKMLELFAIHIQVGRDGEVFREKDWKDYVNGFGKPHDPAYWIGLETMHHLTTANSTGTWEVMISVRFDRHTGRGFNYAIFQDFKVDSEIFEYTMHVGGQVSSRFPSVHYEGSDYDVQTYLLPQYNGMPFTTKDRDNDLNADENCGRRSRGGWWFDSSCSLQWPSSAEFCPNCEDIFSAYANLAVVETSMYMRFIKAKNSDLLF